MPIAKINGINIYYEIEGQGEPLVMIMGLGASQSLWKPQVTDFKKYYRVITYDHRGTGKSEKQDGLYTIKTMADDAVGLMDHLGITKANVLGVSMGGMIAQEIALNYPQRVKKLILGCTYAGLDNSLSSGPTPEVSQIAEAASTSLGISFIKLAYNKPLYKFIIISKIGLRSKFRNRAHKSNGKNGFNVQIKACLKHNTLDRLHLISSPTLVITGSKDRVILPSSSEAIAKPIRGASLVVLKNGSHFFHAEMKKAFNREVLQFLKQI